MAAQPGGGAARDRPAAAPRPAAPPPRRPCRPAAPPSPPPRRPAAPPHRRTAAPPPRAARRPAAPPPRRTAHRRTAAPPPRAPSAPAPGLDPRQQAPLWCCGDCSVTFRAAPGVPAPAPRLTRCIFRAYSLKMLPIGTEVLRPGHLQRHSTPSAASWMPSWVTPMRSRARRSHDIPLRRHGEPAESGQRPHPVCCLQLHHPPAL